MACIYIMLGMTKFMGESFLGPVSAREGVGAGDDIKPI